MFNNISFTETYRYDKATRAERSKDYLRRFRKAVAEAINRIRGKGL